MLTKRISGVALGCVLMVMIPRRRRWMLFGVFVLVLSGVGITGCSGGGSQSGTKTTSGSPGTPAGGYVVTVTAASGSITNTAQVQVTVQ